MSLLHADLSELSSPFHNVECFDHFLVADWSCVVAACFRVRAFSFLVLSLIGIVNLSLYKLQRPYLYFTVYPLEVASSFQNAFHLEVFIILVLPQFRRIEGERQLFLSILLV